VPHLLSTTIATTNWHGMSLLSDEPQVTQSIPVPRPIGPGIYQHRSRLTNGVSGASPDRTVQRVQAFTPRLNNSAHMMCILRLGAVFFPLFEQHLPLSGVRSLRHPEYMKPGRGLPQPGFVSRTGFGVVWQPDDAAYVLLRQPGSRSAALQPTWENGKDDKARVIGDGASVLRHCRYIERLTAACITPQSSRVCSGGRPGRTTR